MLEAYLERCSQTQKLQQNTYVRELRLHALTRDVAKDNIEELSKYLPSTRHGIATDESSDETDEYLPVIVRHEGPEGLIQTSLLNIPDKIVGSDAQTMFNTIDNSIKSAKLSWDYCITYCSDNTSSMVGKKNSLLTKIKSAQQCGQGIVDVGCTCHLTYLCAEKGAKELYLSQH